MAGGKPVSKLRTGRKNPHNLYLQRGREPSDQDVCLGLIINPAVAEILVKMINEAGELDGALDG